MVLFVIVVLSVLFFVPHNQYQRKDMIIAAMKKLKAIAALAK